MLTQSSQHKVRRTAPPLKKPISPYQLYLNSLAISGRTAMATLLNQCSLILGHDGVADTYDWQHLTFEQVHHVRSALTEMGYSVNTINMTIAGLRGITRTAFNLGLMSADNMMRINALKVVKGRTTSRKGRRLNNSEIKKLKTATRHQDNPTKRARDLALLMVGIGTGVRCAEICALDLDSINFGDGKLVIEKGKGRKQRQIYVSASVLRAITKWVSIRGSQSGPLFSRILRNGSITNKRLSTSGITYALRKVQERADIEPFSPHDLRRTFITHLLEKGVDLNIVRQLAGHSDVSTTVRYDKRDELWQKQASQGLQF